MWFLFCLLSSRALHVPRFGINCVRFHFLDSNWGKDSGIFPRGPDTTRRLDAEQLDRLDHFVWRLKRRGIYSNINLNVGRDYRKGDGVADFGLLGLGKALQYFDDHIAERHREYARQLLRHRNPYTKAEYRNEPAVVTVETDRTQALIGFVVVGRKQLRGLATEIDTTFCSIVLTSLDGELPTLIEPVTGTVTLRRRGAGAKLTPTPLSGAAAPLAGLKPGITRGEGTSFALNQPTVRYLIRGDN